MRRAGGPRPGELRGLTVSLYGSFLSGGRRFARNCNETVQADRGEGLAQFVAEFPDIMTDFCLSRAFFWNRRIDPIAAEFMLRTFTRSRQICRLERSNSAYMAARNSSTVRASISLRYTILFYSSPGWAFRSRPRGCNSSSLRRRRRKRGARRRNLNRIHTWS